MARANAREAAGWEFDVAGLPAAGLRAVARREALATAVEASARMGIPSAVRGDDLIAMTGHQPQLYHPGVWAKVLLLQRFAEEHGAAAIDLVVDSDGFDSVACDMPCMRPAVQRCRVHLALGTGDGHYSGAPVPTREALREFRDAGAEALGTLPAPALGRHFGAFCDGLDAAAGRAGNLAELVTMARRSYEAPVGSDYLELPVTEQAKGAAFARFMAHIAVSAESFAEAYNSALARFRSTRGVRSAARPFPDLAVSAGVVELPFWWIAGGRRHALSVRRDGRVSLLAAGLGPVVSAGGAEDLADALAGADAVVAPKALTLTMFERLFVADLFLHGVGGGRYDVVTDEVIRRFFGVEPPRLAVASLTVYLPLGARIVSNEEVEAAEHRLNRLEHNPDQFLGEMEFASAVERERASNLADEKRLLVAGITVPGADKKALGRRIRELNARIRDLLAPEVADARMELDRLVAGREAADVLTDRSYPFCLWNPAEIADKVR